MTLMVMALVDAMVTTTATALWMSNGSPQPPQTLPAWIIIVTVMHRDDDDGNVRRRRWRRSEYSDAERTPAREIGVKKNLATFSPALTHTGVD